MSEPNPVGHTEQDRKGRAPGQHVAVRLQPEQVARLDALAEALAPGLPAGMRGLTRSDVLRATIEAGMVELERRMADGPERRE